MGDCRTVGLAAFVTVSCLTYLGELVLSTYVAYLLYTSGQFIWFALILGFLLVPLIGSQCFSWLLRTGSEAEAAKSTQEKVIMTMSHIGLMGQMWRYCRLGYSHRIAITRNEIWCIFAVRIVHTFCSTLPLLSLQCYFVLYKLRRSEEADIDPVALASLATLLFSACWSVATYMKYTNYCCVIGSITPWANAAWKVLWRVGEIVSRVLTLSLFAACYVYWIFLVLGLHWITMLVLQVMEIYVFQAPEKKGKTVKNALAGSYVYMFCSFNVGPKKSKAGFVLYHTIVCLESITLLVLWIVHGGMSYLHVPLSLVVVTCYILSLMCATVYYGCFHRLRATSERDSTVEKRTEVCLHQCITCRLDGLGKREGAVPYQAEWVHIQDNPNPQFFDMLSDQDSCITTPTGSVMGQCRDKHCRRCKINAQKARETLDNRCALCREKQYTKCKHNFCHTCKGRGCLACAPQKPWLPPHPPLTYKKCTDTYCRKCIYDLYKRKKRRELCFTSSDGDSSVTNVRATSSTAELILDSRKIAGATDLNASRATSHTGELSWDNYDLQLDQPELVSHAQGRKVTDKGGKPVGYDLGYYSGISSSSNGNSQVPALFQPSGVVVRGTVSDCSGFTSDDYSSATSFSRFPLQGGCRSCGHQLALESASLYSGASSGTFNSSQFASAMSEIIDEVNSELYRNQKAASTYQKHSGNSRHRLGNDSLRGVGRRKGKHRRHAGKSRRRGGRRRGDTMSDETSTCSTMGTGFTGSQF